MYEEPSLASEAADTQGKDTQKMKVALRSLKMRNRPLHRSPRDRVNTSPGAENVSPSSPLTSSKGRVDTFHEQENLSQRAEHSEQPCVHVKSVPCSNISNMDLNSPIQSEIRLGCKPRSSGVVYSKNNKEESVRLVTEPSKRTPPRTFPNKNADSPQSGAAKAGTSPATEQRAALATMRKKRSTVKEPEKKPSVPQDGVHKNQKSSPSSQGKAEESVADESVVDEAWLLQRQLEVELSLRKKICSTEDILELAKSFQNIVQFFKELGDLSGSLQIPSGAIFQEILSQLSESNLDFDKQGRVGDIPMHQAKVLNRRPRLEAEGNIVEHIGAGVLERFLQPVQDLRALLRVKVEDSNDLCMAEEAAKTTARFLSGLSHIADKKQLSQFQALEALRAY
ncbi:hypothetical protein CYMTET_16211 [Cymbomonas tetramitiformis]|uniref:Uncharacterized protein n=1 Tax=Cymbomonas tetramitiformis TaxID=36881 RepID=A0AAE0GCZ7_9CHLO|nr:hypothetical protein CYMTET_16211 [Cymbomonas tetramitiformis]